MRFFWQLILFSGVIRNKLRGGNRLLRLSVQEYLLYTRDNAPLTTLGHMVMVQAINCRETIVSTMPPSTTNSHHVLDVIYQLKDAFWYSRLQTPPFCGGISTADGESYFSTSLFPRSDSKGGLISGLSTKTLLELLFPCFSLIFRMT